MSPPRRRVAAGVALLLLAAPPLVARPVVAAGAVVAADTVDAHADAVAARLQRRAHGAIKRGYAAIGFRPLWASEAGIGAAAGALLFWLDTADRDGLDPRRYHPERVRAAIAAAGTGDPDRIARAELALSEAFARFAADQRKPARFETTILDPELEPKKPDPETLFRAAALPPDFAAYIADMAWMSPHYVALRALAGDVSDDDSRDRLRRNLDRARLLPGPWTRHVVVDASAGRLWYYQAGALVGSMKVIVGKPATPTPMLAGMLQYAILNPYWNVPVDLAQTLVAPRVLAGRSLKSMGFEALSDWSAAPARLNPARIDWRAVAAGETELRLRQLPGGGNSMGRVKFLFPNDLGIYLHDTPERELFKADDRHFSNGCIRLEDAAALGRFLLGRPIRTARRDPEQLAALPAPVPVYLTYLTVIEGGDGLGFRPDVYDRDH